MIKTPLAALAVGFALALGAPAQAQTSAPAYSPSVGQEGKDVIWVPSPQALVDRMLEMAQVTPQDYLVDLGSGDGRTVITAAKRGVRALGIEYNPDMVAFAKAAAEKEGVANLAQFERADIFEYDFSRATVVTMFLLPQLNIRLRPTLLAMKPGTRLVSNSFDMGDWTPDERAEAGAGCTQYCRAMLWIVPAKAGGSWNVANGGKLTLNQTYQNISGSLVVNGATQTISTGKMRGEAIEFVAGGRRYSGKVDGDTMVLTSEGGQGEMTATRG